MSLRISAFVCLVLLSFNNQSQLQGQTPAAKPSPKEKTTKTTAPTTATVAGKAPTAQPASGGAGTVQAAAPVVKQVMLTGAFGTIRKLNGEALDSARPAKLNVAVFDANVAPTATGGVATAYLMDDSHVSLSYTMKTGDKDPATVFLGDKDDDHPFFEFPFTPASVTSLSLRHVTLAGDFCQKGIDQKCTTKLVTEADGSPLPKPTGITGYVYSSDGATSVTVIVNSVQKDIADVQFTADAGFTPAWLVLRGDGKAQTFHYNLATPVVAGDYAYRVMDLKRVCPEVDTKAKRYQCSSNQLPTAKVTMPSGGSAVVTAMQDDMLFVRVVAREDQIPNMLVVEKRTEAMPKDQNQPDSTMANRLTRLAADQSLLSVDMTIMDQETMYKNYGHSIAELYTAVMLDVSNRTDKKLQFNKGAIWFDLSFKKADGPKHHFGNRLADWTMDLYPKNPYKSVFEPTPNGESRLVQASPYDYRAILNAYDYTTEKTDRILKTVELAGSVLTTIGTSGVVGGTGFRDGVAIFTGAFLPGVRATILDVPSINRYRQNLVEATLQETVQISPRSHTSTIVMLPRYGVLAMGGGNDAYAIDQVLNVHIDPDVINGTKDVPVPMGHVEVGYTKDQVRQSLGEPPTVTTQADGSVKFSYAAGPYQDVTFNKDGQAITWIERALADQVKVAADLASATQVLTQNHLSYTTLQLLDGTTVLAGIQNNPTLALWYDKDGKHKGDYTLLYTKIAGFVTKQLTALEAELAKDQLPASVASVSPVKDTHNYAMPDVKNGIIIVTLEADGKTIKDISFDGIKPFTGTKPPQ